MFYKATGQTLNDVGWDYSLNPWDGGLDRVCTFTYCTNPAMIELHGIDTPPCTNTRLSQVAPVEWGKPCRLLAQQEALF